MASVSIIAQCVEEIALEGLDGITIEGLWKRLHHRPGFTAKLDDEQFKEYLWINLMHNRHIELFVLPEARPLLEFLDIRCSAKDNDSHKSPKHVEPKNQYPYHLVKTVHIRGSCSTYETRENYTKEIQFENASLSSVESRFGNKLVLVADQDSRTQALLGWDAHFDDFPNITDAMYGVLERIGRSRYYGETTYGNNSLQHITGENNGTVFYMKKVLLRSGFIKAQKHFYMCGGRLLSGSLLHLSRYYANLDIHGHSYLNQIYEYMLAKPNHSEEVMKFRRDLNISQSSFKKIIRGRYRSVFELEMIPLLQYNPETEERAALTKMGVERTIRIVRMNVSVAQKTLQSLSESSKEQDEPDDEGEDGQEMEYGDGRVEDPMALPAYNRSFLDIVYGLIDYSGQLGLSAAQLRAKLSCTRNVIRGVLRMLEYHKAISFYKQDIGRQRIMFYITTRNKTSLEAQIGEQRKRMLAITGPTEGCERSVKRQRLDEHTNTDVVSSQICDMPVSGFDKLTTTEKVDEKITSVSPEGVEVIERTIVTKSQPKPLLSKDDLHDETTKQLRRAVRIIELVREHRVIPTITELRQMLQKDEDQQATSGKHLHQICRRSVMRLVSRLHKDGYVKCIQLTLRYGDRERHVTMVCDTTVGMKDAALVTTLDTIKCALVTSSQRHTSEPKDEIAQVSPAKNLKSSNYGAKYGYQAKCRRMLIVYKLLHYLLYTYDGEQFVDGEGRVRYQSGLSTWKTFLPPLPNHEDLNEGWCILADVLLTLPLSVMMQVVNFPFVIDGIEEYLEDPVKQHLLVYSLPQRLRDQLLQGRRFVHAFHDVIVSLCHLGLASFGPAKFKDKSQVYVFLRRRTRLKDTSEGPKSYVQLDQDFDYPVVDYFLQTEQDVNDFWYRLECICLQTPLSCYAACQNKTYTHYTRGCKQDLIEAASNQDFDKVFDDGFVPGDGLGAAGFDSSRFLHMRRNWLTVASVAPLQKTSVSSVLSKTTEPVGQPAKRLIRLDDKKVTEVTKAKFRRVPNLNARIHATKKDQKAPKIKKVRSVYKKVKRLRRREVEPCSTRRVEFSKEHDNIMMITKAVSRLLMPQFTRSHVFVSPIVHRDIIRKLLPELSVHMTSTVIQRRLRNMVKMMPHLDANVEVIRMKAQADVYVKEMINSWTDKDRTELFCLIVEYLWKQFSEKSQTYHDLATLSESSFDIISTRLNVQADDNIGLLKEPVGVSDVKFATLLSMVKASFGCAGDKNSWSFLLYLIYDQYPDIMARQVAMHLKKSRVISGKRLQFVLPNKTLPSLPYRLSFKFINTLHISRFSEPVWYNCSQIYQKLVHSSVIDCGQFVNPLEFPVVAALLLSDKISVTLDMNFSPIDFDTKYVSQHMVSSDYIEHRKSRSYLYMMRNNLQEHFSDNVRRPQDYILVTAFPITYQVESDILYHSSVQTMAGNAFKLKNAEHGRLVNLLTRLIPYDEVSAAFFDVTLSELDEATVQLFGAIRSRGAIGITDIDCWLEARDLFAFEYDVYERAIETLITSNLIVQVGIFLRRYVTLENSRSWLIKTYKVPKDLRREMTEAGKELMGDQPPTDGDCSIEDTVSHTLSVIIDTIAGDGDTIQSRFEPSVALSNRAQVFQKNVSIVSATKRLLDITRRDIRQVFFVPAPWRKPDATLNHRLFTMYITSVFSFILDNPGCSDNTLQNHFAICFQSYIHCRVLIDILEKIGCVRKQYMHEAPATLFSDPDDGFELHHVICDKADKAIYEPTSDAVHLFSSFVATSLNPLAQYSETNKSLF